MRFNYGKAGVEKGVAELATAAETVWREQPAIAVDRAYQAVQRGLANEFGGEVDPRASLEDLLAHAAKKGAICPALVRKGDLLEQLWTLTQNANCAVDSGHAWHSMRWASEILREVSGDLCAPWADRSRPVEPDPNPGRVFPTWQEINELKRQEALTEGEREIIEYLDEHLVRDWSIYVQPYVLGLRPDVVLLHPSFGLVIIEVKDWNLDAYIWKDDRIVVRSSGATLKADPVQQCERVAEVLLEGPAAAPEPPTIRRFVFFSQASKRQVLDFYHGRGGSCSLLSYEAVESDALARALNEPRSKSMAPGAYFDLERLLQKPTCMADKGRAIPLHKDQIAATIPIWSEQKQKSLPEGQSFVRYRGPAGSGKSTVLAYRTARAAALGKRVLLVSFHITMTNFLHDQLMRTGISFDFRNVTIRHFHGFLKDEMVEQGLWTSRLPGEERTLSEYQVMVAQLQEPEERGKFDAIYVDEAQDFDRPMLDQLATWLRPCGEMVLMADHRQNIYRRDGGRGKEEPYEKAVFRGRWRKLSAISRRLPDRLSDWLNGLAFAKQVGDDEDPNLEPAQLRMGYGDEMIWIDCEATEIMDWAVWARKFVKSLQNRDGKSLHVSDVAFLAADKSLGLQLKSRLIAEGLDAESGIHDLFGSGMDRHKKKRSMFLGNGKLCLSTIHSFKGWELSCIVVLWNGKSISMDDKTEDLNALFYTAVSRTLQHLIVINCDPEMKGMGADWDTVEWEGEDEAR